MRHAHPPIWSAIRSLWRSPDAVPVRVLSSGAILVAVADPQEVDLEDLKQQVGGEVVLAVADRSAIHAAWRHLS